MLTFKSKDEFLSVILTHAGDPDSKFYDYFDIFYCGHKLTESEKSNLHAAYKAGYRTCLNVLFKNLFDDDAFNQDDQLSLDFDCKGSN